MLQAEFSEINLAAYSDSGTVVDIQVSRGGTKVVRYVFTYSVPLFQRHTQRTYILNPLRAY